MSFGRQAGFRRKERRAPNLLVEPHQPLQVPDSCVRADYHPVEPCKLRLQQNFFKQPAYLFRVTLFPETSFETFSGHEEITTFREFGEILHAKRVGRR